MTNATRRQFNARQIETVQKVLDAAMEELRQVGFEAMTLRTVAHRASVAPATVYNYFSSKNHVVAEIFWRLVNDHVRDASPDEAVADRISSVFADLIGMLQAEPALGPSVTAALLGPEPDVRHLRTLIGIEITNRITDAAAGEASAEQLDALGLAWAGALLQAGMGHAEYDQIDRRLATTTALILTGAP